MHLPLDQRPDRVECLWPFLTWYVAVNDPLLREFLWLYAGRSNVSGPGPYATVRRPYPRQPDHDQIAGPDAVLG